MSTRLLISVAAALLALGTGAATAQTAGRAPDTTGLGGGPASTATAPNTTATGTTKPPGAAGGPLQSDRRAQRDNQKIDRMLERGICKGC